MNIHASKQYEVSDPEYYVPLITEQKKKAQKKPSDARHWLEIGRLHEARIDMIKHMAVAIFGYDILSCSTLYIYSLVVALYI